MKVDWDWDKSEVPKGHTMPFMQALATAPQAMILRAGLPRWLMYLTKRGRQALRSFKEMEVGHLSTFNQRSKL